MAPNLCRNPVTLGLFYDHFRDTHKDVVSLVKHLYRRFAKHIFLQGTNAVCFVCLIVKKRIN